MKKEKKPLISILTNAVHYYKKNVIIVFYDDCCRLIVTRPRVGIVLNKIYPSIRGTRIAFSKFYGANKAMDNVTPSWSKQFETIDPKLLDLIGQAEQSGEFVYERDK